MSGRRRAASLAAVGVAPLALTALAAAPASAHGSMGDPVSRVFQCYAEGPESPRSAACKAAVAAGGTQALYDWNGIRIGDANGRHQQRVPDGKLCSAGNAEFKGLDLARADWPTTAVSAGAYTFRYRVTAPHKGTFNVYLSKDGYDPSKPLAWGDLDLAHPVATKTDPVATNGYYSFSGTLPKRSGKQLLYAVWQRSDSPEAFYSCSDVTFGGSGGSGNSGSGNGGSGGSGSGSSGSAGGGSGSGGTGGGASPRRARPRRPLPLPPRSRSPTVPTSRRCGTTITTPRTLRPRVPPPPARPATRTRPAPPPLRPIGPRRPVPRRTSPRPAATPTPPTSRSGARARWRWARRRSSPRCAAAR